MATIERKNIVIGSGKIYISEFSGTIPERNIIETAENLIGHIQGGASIEYKPEFYTASDDLGLISKTVVTKEEVILKSGILTWNGNTFKKITSTARVTEDTVKKIRTTKIGGTSNQDGKKYIIRFVHSDKIDGDKCITIIGNNQSGFEAAFAPDKETVINAEFKAVPNDAEGTLIIFEEPIEVTV